MGSLNWSKRESSHIDEEPWYDLKKETFEVEGGGKQFKFVEIQPTEPSNVLIVHFPGLGKDGEKEAEAAHIGMGQRYSTMALKSYGREHSRDILVSAIKTAIGMRGAGKKIVLHGGSLGAAVVYDFIGDVQNHEFLRGNNVVGAILETPVLDREHLSPLLRKLPNSMLTSGATGFVRSGNGMEDKGEKIDVDILKEALREKTVGKFIEIPTHVIFAERDSLADNDKTLATLRAQAKMLTHDSAESKASRGRAAHMFADSMKVERAEVAVVERFCGRGQA